MQRRPVALLLLALLLWCSDHSAAQADWQHGGTDLAWQAHTHELAVGMLSTDGRSLLQNSSGPAAAATPAANNCSCAQTRREEPVLQLIGYCGVMPLVKHYTYAFLQRQKALGQDAQVTSVTERFSSPDDLRPLIQQQPNYDYAITEHQGTSGVFTVQSGSGAQIFQPPAWLQEYKNTGQIDPAEVRTAMDALLFQSINLLGTRPTMLSYRQDVLTRQGLTVPETWDQLLQVAAKLNGTDMNGDGLPDYALCFDVDARCKLYWTFSSVAATILQANGSASGYLLDPDTGEYLIRSEGMLVALRLWGQLMTYNSPEQNNKAYCGVWEDAFAEGRCAFTLNTLQLNSFNVLLTGSPTQPYAWGHTAQAPVPGSTSVWDRTQRKMVDCTPTVCPFATPLDVDAVPPGAASSGASVPLVVPARVAIGGDTDDDSLPAVAPAGAAAGGGSRVRVWVNRAPVMCVNANTQQDVRSIKATNVALRAFGEAWPLSMTSWLYLAFSPSSLASPSIQDVLTSNGIDLSRLDQSVANLTYYTSAQFIADVYDWVDFQKNQSVWRPSRPSLNSSLGSTVPWLGAAAFMGMVPEEAGEYLALTVWQHAHANAVPDPQMVSPLRIAVAVAAHHAQEGLDESLILADIEYKLNLWSQEPSTFWNRDLYNSDIGYVPRQTWNRSAYYGSSPPASSGLTSGQLAAAILVPLLVLLAALGGVGFMVLQSRRRAGYDMFGRVRPPSPGLLTTLLVTDIERSTELWETLPGDVMQRAMQLHHNVLRDKLQKYKGYETATEGDSFLIAFHTPRDALRYCLAVQSDLLQAPWPEELGSTTTAHCAGEVLLQCTPGAMAWLDGKTLLKAPTPPASLSQSNGEAGALHTVPGHAWWRLWASSQSPSSRARVSSSPPFQGSMSQVQLAQFLDSNDGIVTTPMHDRPPSSVSGMLPSPCPASPPAVNTNTTSGVGAAASWDRAAEASALSSWLSPKGIAARRPRSQLELPSLPLLPSLNVGQPLSNSTAAAATAAAAGDGAMVSLQLERVATASSAVAIESTGTPLASAGTPLASAADALGQEQSWSRGEQLELLLARQVWAVAPTSFSKASHAAQRAAATFGDGAPMLAFRGLRVRMGLHSGLTDPLSWTINQETSRWCASGSFLATTKAVCDAGSGGMVLLSRECWKALQLFGVPPDCVALHMGEHQLAQQDSHMALYLAMPRLLAGRLALFPLLRTLKLTSPSILQAPVGQAAVVFMHAVGVAALRTWDADVTASALRVYHKVVRRGLLKWGGYLVELADGLCLAAFSDPAAALCWALSAQAELLHQDWEPRLLTHELCEEMSIPVSGHSGHLLYQLVQDGSSGLAPEAPGDAGHRAPLHMSPLGVAASAHSWPSASSNALAAGRAGAGPAGFDALRWGRSGLAPGGTGSLSGGAGIGATERPGPTLGRLEEGDELGSTSGHVAGPSGQQHVTRGVSSACGNDTKGPSFLTATAGARKVLLRGLRVKAGIDLGEVHCRVNPATGRMAYMGKIMNRAARISNQATSSQMLCSVGVWTSCCLSSAARSCSTGGTSMLLPGMQGIAPIIGTSLGAHPLKGISEKVHLVQCTLDDSGL